MRDTPTSPERKRRARAPVACAPGLSEGTVFMRRILFVLSILAFLSTCPLRALRAGDDKNAPRCADPRLRIDRFAAAPNIVHPIGIAFDARGRLLVIESHTHFRPQDY